MTRAPLEVSREQILAFRRGAQFLDERLPSGPESLRRAAWAGLQDSMPRAAVLSIHARVEGTTPDAWSDASLAQVWGPRFSVYVVAAEDAPLFTIGRYPDDARGRAVAEEMAEKIRGFLQERRLTDREVGLGIRTGNRMRYGTTTGTLRIRWEGARAPLLWTVDRPAITAVEARIELARRYLHVFGPTTSDSFTKWAGIAATQGRQAFDALAPELIDVRTPSGAAYLLATDEPALLDASREPARARLLPSGDTFYLLWGADRELLVPDASRRDRLWTSRVWPGALLVGGDIAGTWRRDQGRVWISPWRGLTSAETASVEREARSLPLPDLAGRIEVGWEANA